jgi:hypothetical protein
MKKYLFFLALVAAISLGFGAYNRMSAKVNVDDVTLANMQAFTSSTSLNCEYVRTTEKCVIRVSAGVEVDVLGIGITSPKADGTIEIDGVVVCSADGNTACSPVECIELYSLKYER